VAEIDRASISPKSVDEQASLTTSLTNMREAVINNAKVNEVIAYPESIIALIGESQNSDEVRRVDFNHPEQCAQSKPLSCFINGQAIIPSKWNWSQLLVAITERFIVDRNRNLDSLNGKPLYGSKTFFLSQKTEFGTCAELSNGKWIYTNYNPQTIIMIIRNLCRHCDVDLDDVNIAYEPKGGSSAQETQKHSRSAYSLPAVKPNMTLDPSIIEELTGVLAAHFSNGFRLDSFIETGRLRKFAEKLLGHEITLTDEELEQYVKTCGTIFEGKVYVVSTVTKAKIKELAENYFAEGATAIFYEEFYSKHSDWLMELSVVSEDMLTEILRTAFPGLSFTQTYFGNTADSIFNVLEKEILRVWGDDVLLTYEKLAERLQYIPIARIKYALGQNADFVWNATGEFTHVSKVFITDEEKSAVCQFVETAVKTHGYVSIADVPFGNIDENNYELSITAIHNSVYHKCLSDKYEQHGKIITPKGIAVDAKHIMDEYCRSLDRCTLDDLLAFEHEITGECHRWIPMQAGYDIMVRVDKDNYLADKFFSFDRNAIDNAIEHFINGGEYVPLRHITTFAPFPHCGQEWTLFLLESYCRRYSERFRFDALSVNSTNAGAIVRKYSKLNYHDIMVDAVAKSGVSLNANAVLDFLAAEGYTSQRRYAKVNELLTQATAQRG